MLTVTGKSAEQPTAAEKAAALELVLKSRTFQKSDLLIRFLKYIGDQERDGNAAAISEYGIATEALGRQPDFSPESDSSVRSRAHALRRKLEDCYRDELTDAPLRIVLPKGSYVPEYHYVEAHPQPDPPSVQQPNSPRQLQSLVSVAAFSLLIGIIGTYTFLRWQPNAQQRIPSVLAAAWGPLLEPAADVLIMVAVPKQLWVREFPNGVLPRNEKWYPGIAQDDALKSWYYQSNPASAPPGSFLLLHPNVGSPLWGDSVAAAGAASLLSQFGISHQILPERVLKPYALRGKNAILFGSPEYSPAIASALKDTPYSIAYDPQSRWEAIINRKPSPGEPSMIRRDKPDHCLGLITVTTAVDSAGRRSRKVIFSGLTSAGAQAAQEFFASPDTLSALNTRFRSASISSWPDNYQVLIEASTDTNLPLKSRFLAYRLVTP